MRATTADENRGYRGTTIEDYGIAVAYTIIASVLHSVLYFLLEGIFGLLPGGVLLFIYLIAAALSALRGGIGPGLVTVALSEVGVNYFWFLRRGEVWLPTTADQGRALVLLLSGTIIVLLGARSRRATLRAQAAAVNAMVAQGRLSALVYHSPIEIFIKDQNGRYLLTNRRFDELRSGKRTGSLAGKDDAAIFPPELARVLVEHDQRVIRENTALEFRESIPLPSGERRNYLTVKFPIYSSDGAFLGVGGLSSDITESIRQREALEKAVKAREDVLAVVSHDLKNPLAGIKLSSMLLSRALTSKGDAKLRQALAGIERAASNMEQLIKDLLDVSRIEAGRLDIETSELDPAQLVNATILDLERLALSKSITIGFENACEPCRIRGDSDRLSRVLANLVGNAVKFTPEGGHVEIATSLSSSEVLFRVSDSGPGIPAENLPHVFERYWQAKETAKKGTGLGLAIAKGIVEAHGGRIWVESTQGRGASFFFTIPLAQGNPEVRSA